VGTARHAHPDFRGKLEETAPLGKGGAGSGERPCVFCASLADWLDNKAPQEWRVDLAALIAATPELDWLLLTKRIENYRRLAPWKETPPNVWLGVTAENQGDSTSHTDAGAVHQLRTCDGAVAL
jgi:protein gp37